MSDLESNVSKQARLIIGALAKLLRPLVKLLINCQVTFPMLSELLKSVYVDVARTEYKLEKKKITDSRISVLTGVHRKDIRRIREEDEPNNDEPSVVSLGTQLISVWMTDPKYIDNKGQPKPLAKRDGRSGVVDFETLVQSVGKKDIHARSVLDDWLKLGVVEFNDSDEVVLLHEAFIPEKGFDEKVFFFRQNIHDHLAAVANNLIGESAPLLERAVYYSELSVESVLELQELAKEHAMKALREVDKRAKQLKRRDSNRDIARRKLRMNFGTYFYKETKNTEEDEDVA